MSERRDFLTGAVGGAALGSLATLLATRPATAAPDNAKLDYLIDLGIALLEKFDRLIEVTRGIAFPELTITQQEAFVVLPPELEALETVMIRLGLGRFSIPTWRTALACPAGVTTELPFNIPSGHVAYSRTPALISSDFYDPDIGVNVYSDAFLINPLAPMPLTGPFAAKMGEHVTQWTQLRFEVINGTVVDATLSFQVYLYLFDQSFWDSFATPMLDAIEGKLGVLLK